MSKLYGARSLLYRRQILQQNIRWKALDEIYKIYVLLHRSDLNISENFRQFFFAFFGNILQKFLIFEFFSLIFAQMLMKFCRNFADSEKDFRFLVVVAIKKRFSPWRNSDSPIKTQSCLHVQSVENFETRKKRNVFIAAQIFNGQK